MAGSDFLLSMTAVGVLGWASYYVITQISSKRQKRCFSATSWGLFGIISLMLGLCEFSAANEEHSLEKQDALCSDHTVECYAKTHHNPVRQCKELMDEKASFRHVWQESKAQPVFKTYIWHNEKMKIIQAFGQEAKAINNMNMLIPLQYFCIFNANTGEIIAASFE
ncbi:TPA: hypothetical protein QHT37_004084 [Enterobacter roggenkampii]|nr:hypothetical protein [Enterobacter roggenkampii]